MPPRAGGWPRPHAPLGPPGQVAGPGHQPLPQLPTHWGEQAAPPGAVQLEGPGGSGPRWQ
ncbi:hypothetical protein HaLaN_21148 [Haematococcus lacustris]|uniref:Uncharacterized protein n=1 Tax=Haematococcus lacustris TaxID=44745 RepID=A0A699ZNL1_HAELA|nr:hypothetical protein HaLaN_21148 [Haematococcus lacustris]